MAMNQLQKYLDNQKTDLITIRLSKSDLRLIDKWYEQKYEENPVELSAGKKAALFVRCSLRTIT